MGQGRAGAAVTIHPENFPAGTRAGQGDAAEPTPRASAAAPGAASTTPGGTWGTTERADGEGHSPSPSAPEPAPGRSPLAGAEGGRVEPPSPAPVSPVAQAAAAPCDGLGTTSRNGQREQATGPVLGGSGPVPSTPPATEGFAFGAREEGPGGTTPAAGSPPAQDPPGGARSSAAPPGAEPKRPGGQDYRDAARKAKAGQARAARNRRGQGPVKRRGNGAGMIRRLPPGGDR